MAMTPEDDLSPVIAWTEEQFQRLADAGPLKDAVGTKHCLVGSCAHPAVPGPLAERFAAAVKETEEVIDGYKAKCNAHRQDPHLTPAGRDDRVEVEKVLAEKRVRAVYAVFDKEAAHAQLYTGFKVQPKLALYGEFADDERKRSVEAGAAEVRRGLRELTPVERAWVVAKAALAGDKATLAALDHDPLAGTVPMLPWEFLTKAHELLAAAGSTVAYQRHVAVGSLRGDAAFNLQRALPALGLLPDSQRTPQPDAA